MHQSVLLRPSPGLLRPRPAGLCHRDGAEVRDTVRGKARGGGGSSTHLMCLQTVYEEVCDGGGGEEQCTTVEEQVCSTVEEQQCSTVTEKVCETNYKTVSTEECGTELETKCETEVCRGRRGVLGNSCLHCSTWSSTRRSAGQSRSSSAALLKNNRHWPD